jgi:hypothetical protein
VSSPRTSTNMKLAVQGPWSTLPETLQNAQVLRSWFEYDSLEYDSEMSQAKRPGLNWHLILGFVLVSGMSVGFWTGAACLVAQFWK